MTGLLVALGLLDLGYRRYCALWLEGANVRQQLATLEDESQAAPKLDSSVLEVTLVARPEPQVGNRGPGRWLGLRFVDRSLRGIGGCRLRAVQLERQAGAGWKLDPEFRPQILGWERANIAEDIPPGGERSCRLVSAFLNDPSRPSWQPGCVAHLSSAVCTR